MSNLDDVTGSFLRDRGLVVVSNRGPVQYRLVNGGLRADRGSGGLVTAISSLSSLVPFTWVASALSEGDRYVAQSNAPIPLEGSTQESLSVRYVVNPESAYQKYYNIFSNPFLWFVQHYMWDLVSGSIDRTIHEAWNNGYVPVNEALANAAVKEAEKYGKSPVVMIQDYQLYLVGGLVRQALPQAIIQHFIHIPWPAPRYWGAMLPKHMRLAILASLCACDIVGFQTRRDAENFVSTCEDLLPGTEVDLNAMTVRFQGRTTFAQRYPISIELGELRNAAESPKVREYENRLRSLNQGMTIARIDRLDPTKNILRGFKAYELLLSTHLELLGKVSFLAFLVPSRTEIIEYQRYREAILESISRINESFGSAEWTPIHVFYEENYLQAIAGMRIADVLLVNPIIDGMNLVAKEAPIVSTNNCALVLSETVGAYEQLKNHVIPVSPADIEGTAVALYDALMMAHEERARRIQELRRSIEREDITYWLRLQLEDLSALAF